MSQSKEFSVGLFDKEPFTATATKSNVTVEVGEDTSLLQALLDAGVPMKYSCEGGTCGTCVVPLVSGEVEYENEYSKRTNTAHASRAVWIAAWATSKSRPEPT